MATNTPLQSFILASSSASVTFSNIPQNYTDLVIVCSVLGTHNSGVKAQYNGDTSSSTYSSTYLYANSTNAYSNRNSTGTFSGLNLAGYTIGISTINPSFTETHIFNYSNTAIYKSTLTRSGYINDSLTQETEINVGTWTNTAAINSVTIANYNGTAFSAGSTFDLYGISTGVSSYTAKATGGSVYTDATYAYHVFYATGSFTPNQALTADVLVVAGGGGAGGTGYSQGGGGGAGGLLGFTSQSLSSGTSYTVTVGAGGVGAASNTAGTAEQGSNSQFAALTACVGGGGGGTNYHPSGSTFMNGGSGGGGGNLSASTTNRGTGTVGQGNDGAYLPASYQGGGGGGAGEAGPLNVTSTSRGGNGLSTYSSWGAATNTGQNVGGTYWYAGGGAGSANGAGNVEQSRGGYGGGGYAPPVTSTTGQYGPAGMANTGGGGGSWVTGSGGSTYGGNGGSGIIIVRYAR
jgi:hypothetical protein